jgi:hypothetical protein
MQAGGKKGERRGKGEKEKEGGLGIIGAQRSHLPTNFPYSLF